MDYSIHGNDLILVVDREYTLQQLSDRFCLSRKQRHILRSEGRIENNGSVVRNPDTVMKGAVIIHLCSEEIDWTVGSQQAQVVFENELVCVVHKPAGCIIHGEPDDRNCLNARVAAYYRASGQRHHVRPIHRLDRQTSGLVLYSKTGFFQPYFDQMLEEKKIHRHYMAVCFERKGIPDHFTCAEPIGKDRHESNRYRISQSGKPAKTDFEVKKRKNGYVLIGCTLHTGRTHQIRVHLEANGLRIVNDDIYGSPSRDFEYMGLWADTLEYPDPVSGTVQIIRDQPSKDYLYFREEKKTYEV
ncbi:MAG: RluA family pseudouridine synthase [Bulleidia sp.]